MDINRLRWASRRGMLELDLLLEPFLNEVYETLDTDDQARYVALLKCEDQELFGWFLGRVTPEDPELRKIVEKIQAHARRRNVQREG